MSSDTAKPLRLLVVEDADDDYRILLREVRRAGYDVTSERVTNPSELARALEQPWDLLVTDWMLPGFGGLQAIETANARAEGMPCIVISGTPNEDEAMSAMRAGALDFLSKDRPMRFAPAIERALREASEKRARNTFERELRVSEERYRSAFELAPEALLTFDLDNLAIVDANIAAVKLYARSLEELRTGNFVELSAVKLADGRDSLAVATELLLRMRAGQPVAPFEWLACNASGEEIPAEVHLVRLAGDHPRLVRLTVIDLRERRKLEEVRQRTIELELQNRRMQEANRLKSEFLANMSHELRTPLNAIIGFSELLHDGQVPASSPEHHEFLGDILTSGKHLLQLINDVLDLAKVEAGKLDFRPEQVDLSRLVNEVVSITRTTAAQKRINVEANVAPELVDIVIDPGRFKQVAYNFLSNALKFTPEQGRVTVRCTADAPETFRLEVEDTGVGIAPSDLGKLFVEFQQLEQGTAKRHQGTGLGLALSRRLVEAQGGSVGVRSIPNVGSTFHAVLPRQCPVQPSVSRTLTPRTRTGTRTILIVEDDDRDRELIASTLAGVGYGFEIARTGKDALARCQERPFDAVTLDLLLPDMSGLDVLDTLRVGGWLHNTPVIVVTIVPDVKTAMTVSEILRKPLDGSALLSALERAGVRPGSSQVPVGGGE
ncbi:MAG TPA: response regulator [Kofleriaceae bacterium]|nr:response regulator [Kofleriaceae bacterium]